MNHSKALHYSFPGKWHLKFWTTWQNSLSRLSNHASWLLRNNNGQAIWLSRPNLFTNTIISLTYRKLKSYETSGKSCQSVKITSVSGDNNPDNHFWSQTQRFSLSIYIFASLFTVEWVSPRKRNSICIWNNSPAGSVVDLAGAATSRF